MNSKELLTLMPASFQDAYLSRKNNKQLKNWQNQGMPAPPPHIVKQQRINAYKEKKQIDILVETGTYLGDMVWAQRNNFKKIYSIELSEPLALKAQKRFQKFSYIHIEQGDSAEVLKKIVPAINKKAIFG